MAALGDTASLQALDTEAELRAAQAAAAAFAELLEFGRADHPRVPRFSRIALGRVAAASRNLAAEVADALQPTGLADTARQRADVAAQRVRVSVRAAPGPNIGR